MHKNEEMQKKTAWLILGRMSLFICDEMYSTKTSNIISLKPHNLFLPLLEIDGKV